MSSAINLMESAEQANPSESLILDLLEAVKFDPENPPKAARSVFQLNGITVGTSGNLVVIAAPPKAGKSAFDGAFLAAAMSEPGAQCDTLGVTSSNQEQKAVLHFDTEQSKDGWHKNGMRALARAQITPGQTPSFFGSYWLTGSTPQDKQELIKAAIIKAASEFAGVHSIHIDGVADLVADVNDAPSCSALVAWLHRLAVRYDTVIVLVIHTNPSKTNVTPKMRGHLGSELERKAESNLVLTQSGEVTSVHATKQRGEPIPKGKGPSFRFDPKTGMHQSLPMSSAGSVSPGVAEELLKRCKLAMKAGAENTTKEITDNLMRVYQIGEKHAGRLIAQMVECRMILKVRRGVYRLAT